MNQKTLDHLQAAFSGESQARNKYTYFASQARKEGYFTLAAVFEETANNEKEHAKLLFTMLDGLGNSEANLTVAINGETYEYSQMYPTFAKEAQEAGDIKAAKLFATIATVEVHHAKRYTELQEVLRQDGFLKKEERIYWVCSECGYVHEDSEPPKLCPLCKHPREYYKRLVEIY